MGRGRVSGPVKHIPQDRDSDAVVDDGKHGEVEVAPPELPARAIKGEKPGPRSDPGDPDDGARQLIAAERDLLEEALQAAIVRRDLGPAWERAGKVAQVDWA